jgi:hypothetical protein
MGMLAHPCMPHATHQDTMPWQKLILMLLLRCLQGDQTSSRPEIWCNACTGTASVVKSLTGVASATQVADMIFQGSKGGWGKGPHRREGRTAPPERWLSCSTTTRKGGHQRRSSRSHCRMTVAGHTIRLGANLRECWRPARKAATCMRTRSNLAPRSKSCTRLMLAVLQLVKHQETCHLLQW